MSTAHLALPKPSQGEIWFVQLPSDPPGKNARPAIIISNDVQNHHPRATTVMVAPLSTTLNPHALRLSPGETGLAETCVVWTNGITTVRKEQLRAPRTPLRKIGSGQMRVIAAWIVKAMGFLPSDIVETGV